MKASVCVDVVLSHRKGSVGRVSITSVLTVATVELSIDVEASDQQERVSCLLHPAVAQVNAGSVDQSRNISLSVSLYL